MGSELGYLCFMLCIFILCVSILTHVQPSPPFLTFGARHSHCCGRLYACSPPGGTQCPPFTVHALVINTHYYYYGLPVVVVSPIGVVVTVCTIWVEQFPPGEDPLESVWPMCLQTIVHGVTWTWSTGALSTVLVEIVQVRWSTADCSINKADFGVFSKSTGTPLVGGVPMWDILESWREVHVGTE
jgi:hypothetical protein